MNRALYVWKLRLCLAAAAVILASAFAPQRPVHEQRLTDGKVNGQVVVESRNPKGPVTVTVPVPAQARQPAATDSRDRISAML
ncbi:hypothetical protein GCM10027034_27540 [Ramlibacter solisilvae]|uniref:Uncharacterized protein n=1 Tax=Ramlibacter tataouinensis TaxID=94132 RepID=A0A127JQT7_9BURK|nr:hypothetical protein [Ramlibacter tataouinensis]AMO22404.1 hypothetical protein UC35_05190 [Ramlibacter tataouinensis]